MNWIWLLEYHWLILQSEELNKTFLDNIQIATILNDSNYTNINVLYDIENSIIDLVKYKFDKNR